MKVIPSYSQGFLNVPRETSFFRFRVFCSEFQAAGAKCIKECLPNSVRTLGTFSR